MVATIAVSPRNFKLTLDSSLTSLIIFFFTSYYLTLSVFNPYTAIITWEHLQAKEQYMVGIFVLMDPNCNQNHHESKKCAKKCPKNY